MSIFAIYLRNFGLQLFETLGTLDPKDSVTFQRKWIFLL